MEEELEMMNISSKERAIKKITFKNLQIIQKIYSNFEVSEKQYTPLKNQ
jgi:hypothetical protein